MPAGRYSGWLGVAFYRAYQPAAVDSVDGVCSPASTRTAKWLVWLAAILVVFFLAFPWFVKFIIGRTCFTLACVRYLSTCFGQIAQRNETVAVPERPRHRKTGAHNDEFKHGWFRLTILAGNSRDGSCAVIGLPLARSAGTF